MTRIAMYACGFILIGLGSAGGQESQVYRVEQQAQWEEWKIPPGTIEFGADGSFVSAKFANDINAALDAGQFTHKLANAEEIQGGIWRVGSTAPGAQFRADNIADGDPTTYWKPDPAADLDDWWIELDLGRAVPVTRIRLVFPDAAGGRPLREFRVMGSDGQRRSFQANLFHYEILGGTTRFNDQTAVEYDLTPLPDISTRVLFQDATDTQVFDPTYRTLQYIRIKIDSKSEDAALAELEAYTFGSNVALGSLARGGSLLDKTGRGTDLIDGDFNTSWAVHGDAEDPTVWILDIGTFVWVDRILQIGANTTGLADSGYGVSYARVNDHRLLASDGSLTLTGDLDFDQLYDDNDRSSDSDFQYIMAQPQAIRYLAAIYVGANGDMAELMVVPTGHFAEVELESDFIDLGAFAGDLRAKQIQGIFWDAATPEGTQVEVVTRTGYELTEEVLYYKLDGSPLAGKAEYEDLNKFLRGDTDTLVVAGADWSPWSAPYREQGQFLSPSPRRFLQIKLTLRSDRPEVAPTMRRLDVNFTDAVLRGAEGEIHPKTAQPGTPETFTYKIWGDFTDPARFDRLLFTTPAHADEVQVTVGGAEVAAQIELVTSDSLMIQLPQAIEQPADTVKVRLRTQIDRNPTRFNAFIGESARPGLWQEVTPATHTPRATHVFFPAVPARLLDNVSIHPRIATPNGDAIGDQAQIRFQVLNVDAVPEVALYSLDGRLVQKLVGDRGPDGYYVYTWSGADGAQGRAAPGLYLCRIRLQTQSDEQQITRTIGLAY